MGLQGERRGKNLLGCSMVETRPEGISLNSFGGDVGLFLFLAPVGALCVGMVDGRNAG